MSILLRSWFGSLVLSCLAIAAFRVAVPLPVQGQQPAKGRVTYSPAGASSYAAGQWGILQFQFTNTTDKPTELLSATLFDDQPGLQFCRRTWVPANARLQLSHPILLPENPSPETKGFNFRTLLLDPNQNNEVLIRGSGGDLQLSGTLRQQEDGPLTAMFDYDYSDREPAPGRELAYELVVAARSSDQLSRFTSQLSDQILPVTEEGYASIDQLVIADDRVSHGGPALIAIRRWLFGGGRLWVMLDRVDPKVLEGLLGDEYKGQVVDRIGLTTTRLESATGGSPVETSTRHHDQPVDLIRLLITDVKVAYTVNGWPAAFWKQCGEGRLLVTTLAPQGWMRLRTAEDEPRGGQGPMARQMGQPPRSGDGRRPPAAAGRPAVVPSPPPQEKPSVPIDPQLAALREGARPRNYMALPAMQDLASEFFAERPAPFLPAAALESQVQEYVGAAVPSRWAITSLLAGFGASIAIAGIVLWRSGRLEWLGAAGPALGLAISFVLVGMGMAQRRAIPPTVASVQFVQPIEGTDDFRASGLTGTFAPDAGPAVIGSRSGGWLMPDRFGLGRKTVRMVWTDLHLWHFENLPATTGLRIAPFAVGDARVERMSARAMFNPEELVGRLSLGGAQHPADAILATPYGRMGVEMRNDGTFRIPVRQVFSRDQFLSASLLSDEQNRRRRTLIDLLTSEIRSEDSPAPERVPRTEFLHEPQILFWADPLELGLEFDASYRRLGAALICVPLTLERPPAGMEVDVPSPLLPYRAVTGPDGLAPSGLWDYRRCQWQRKSLPSSAWLRFQVPPVLLPAEALHGRVIVQVTGPFGKLQIAALRGNEKVPLKTWVDPVGTLTLDITDPALLNVSADGGVLLSIAGGDPARPELTKSSGKTSYWQIESLRLDLHLRASASGDGPKAVFPPADKKKKE